jgi:hypothetical protein
MTATGTKATLENRVDHSVRKWIGVVWLLIEVNLIGGTIFGFPALFQILPQYKIYGDCSSLENDKSSCEGHRTRHYQVYRSDSLLLYMFVFLILECIDIRYYII